MEFVAFKKEWLSEMFTNNGESLMNISMDNPVL